MGNVIIHLRWFFGLGVHSGENGTLKYLEYAVPEASQDIDGEVWLNLSINKDFGSANFIMTYSLEHFEYVVPETL